MSKADLTRARMCRAIGDAGRLSHASLFTGSGNARNAAVVRAAPIVAMWRSPSTRSAAVGKWSPYMSLSPIRGDATTPSRPGQAVVVLLEQGRATSQGWSRDAPGTGLDGRTERCRGGGDAPGRRARQ